jgi:hypothetical protein
VSPATPAIALYIQIDQKKIAQETRGKLRLNRPINFPLISIPHRLIKLNAWATFLAKAVQTGQQQAGGKKPPGAMLIVVYNL